MTAMSLPHRQISGGFTHDAFDVAAAQQHFSSAAQFHVTFLPSLVFVTQTFFVTFFFASASVVTAPVKAKDAATAIAAAARIPFMEQPPKVIRPITGPRCVYDYPRDRCRFATGTERSLNGPGRN